MAIPSQGKLVRDRIPEIIERDGLIAVTRMVHGDDLYRALKVKLLEESSELQEASHENDLEEIADVLEVLFALAELTGHPWSQVLERASEKRRHRGGFGNGVWLVGTVTPEH